VSGLPESGVRKKTWPPQDLPTQTLRNTIVEGKRRSSV